MEPHRSHSRHLARATLTVLGLAIALPLAFPASAQLHPYKLKGRWSRLADSEWGGALGKGTHLALLRGNADSSWVLHWDGHDGNDPRLWLAKPDVDASFSAAVTLTDSNRIFCSGHSALPDGRLLVAGGETVNHTGVHFAYLFDPRNWWNSSNGWTRQTDMLVDRRYATSITLPDGKPLVMGGQRCYTMIAFGGLDAAGLRRDDIGSLHLDVEPNWSGDPTVTRPTPRSGHSAVFDGGSGRMWVFGGDDGVGPRNDLWGLIRTSIDPGERFTWATACDTCNLRPPPRSRHSAVMHGDTMVVFGGKDVSGAALGDVWRYLRSRNRWQQLATTGGPSRYGHTAVLVPGRASSPAPNNAPQMIVFGGRGPDGAIADSTVWALSLPPSGDGQWRALATGPGPPSREGHTAVLDGWRQRSGEYPPKQRIGVFAGEGRSGVLSDFWLLARNDISTSAPEPWSWTAIPTSGPHTPAARTGHVALHDTEWDRVLVIGGDVNGDAAGGLVDDVWQLHFDLRNGPYEWHPLATGDSVPSPRSGSTIVWHPTELLARDSEIFTPSDPGSWQILDADPRYIPYYPHLFVLRNGKLFYSGNAVDRMSMIFDPQTGLWSDRKYTGLLGTYSVMFKPDTIMKCGGDIFSPGFQLGIAVIDSATDITNWNAITAAPMPTPLAYHNLVLLPTGEVLMTAGMTSGNVYVRNPRLWNSRDARGWSDTLATEPANRQYHSAALLLPDGRVLCSGGLPSETHATIFSPPYLFNDDGTPAARPVITAGPPGAGLGYGSTVTVGVDSAASIGIVCLIKPGSVTHQSDFDQRIVRLAFQPTSSTELSVSAPLSPNHAPPGEYLLFVVKTNSGTTDSIPSVAKWVRVGAGQVGIPPLPGPEGFQLHASRPNPASESATLSFDLPIATAVELAVYDMQGRLIRRLSKGPLEPGRHAIEWDLRDRHGRPVRPGIYAYRMRTNGFTGEKKLVVLGN